MRLSQFCAQLPDVTVNRAWISFIVIAPDHLQQLSSGECSTGMYREHHEQVELTVCEG